MPLSNCYALPSYQRDCDSNAQLPVSPQDWLSSKHGIRQRTSGLQKSRGTVKKLLSDHRWQWPKQAIVFLSDLHADGEALLASLVASGGIKRTGDKDYQFKLTAFGKRALFILGGDFFDKGPSNLRVLRVAQQLRKKQAEVKLLAGNHDVRTLIGMRNVGNTNDPKDGHFFVRMGAKSVPFLLEVRENYLTGKNALKGIPSKKTCRNRLLPGERWWQEFPERGKVAMSNSRLKTEMQKIQQKAERFEAICEEAGLSLREAYAAALKWQQLFLSQRGEFYWFYKNMGLTCQRGSFLFLHAGLDDQMAMLLAKKGTKTLNRQFKKQLKGSPSDFYYGPVANTIRTKYRSIDMPLSGKGARHIHESGITAIIHGHRNLHRGQRIALRKNLLHFECDVTLDQGSRKKEGLKGDGAGATIIHPHGYILGISTDFAKIKVFDPRVILAS